MTTRTIKDALKVAGRVVRSGDFWVMYIVVTKCFLFLRWSNPSGSSGDWIAYLVIFNICLWSAFRYRLEFLTYTLEAIDDKHASARKGNTKFIPPPSHGDSANGRVSGF